MSGYFQDSGSTVRQQVQSMGPAITHQLRIAKLTIIAHRSMVINGSFAGLTTALFLGYVLIIACAGTSLTRATGIGSSVTVAISLGYLMILIMMLLTGIYVFLNTRYVEPLIDSLRSGKHD